jgi:hypothetical protein
MKSKPREKANKTINHQTHCHWHEMNRKQRREMMRQIQSEDVSLEVVHPDAAGIDIGNEFHYVAVPPNRDSQPVQRRVSFMWTPQGSNRKSLRRIETRTREQEKSEMAMRSQTEANGSWHPFPTLQKNVESRINKNRVLRGFGVLT